MAVGEKIPMVFFPRFTTITGSDALETTPIDMLGFGQAQMTFWRGEITGTATQASFQVQQSADLTIWEDLGTAVVITTKGATDKGNIGPTQRYIRCTVMLDTNSTCTIWAVGYGERTEG